MNHRERAVFEIIADSLRRRGRAYIPGVGTFHATTRKARRVRNPATGELMMLPETKSVRFKPSKGGVFG
jgi:nucleoid DNA-binding protein